MSEVADIHGVSRSSACKIITKFVDAVNKNMKNIRFPSGRSLTDVKEAFYQKCKIPNTIGAVDGTFVPIIAPKDNEEIFVCRKNFHAINIQAVVDHKMRFTDIVAKWPGSTHDASIFENCHLKNILESHHIGHLLGDSGYPLRKYVLTPVGIPANASEEAYNKAQSSGRMVVERAFGMLKSRFRCLHKTGGCLQVVPSKACKIVAACARLHNFCIENQIPVPSNQQDAQTVLTDDNTNDDSSPRQEAISYRDRIIRLFAN